jgi:hypothetical protein
VTFRRCNNHPSRGRRSHIATSHVGADSLSAMDFWVTVATVLPILGLPLVLTARVHVAQTLDSPILARAAAGLYALILMAIYAMEGVAVGLLAGSIDVPGSEWLQGVAIAVVYLAGLVLILSPGYLLLRIAFAGPGLGLSSAWVVPASHVVVWALDLRASTAQWRITRNASRLQRRMTSQGDRLLATLEGLADQPVHDGAHDIPARERLQSERGWRAG